MAAGLRDFAAFALCRPGGKNGAVSAQTRAGFVVTVDLEGGGFIPTLDLWVGVRARVHEYGESRADALQSWYAIKIASTYSSPRR